MPSQHDIANSEYDPTHQAKKVVLVDNETDPLEGYKPAGMDISANPYYFGYIRTDGSWYVKKVDTTSGTTFCKGESDYTTAWTARAEQTYDLFNVIFS